MLNSTKPYLKKALNRGIFRAIQVVSAGNPALGLALNLLGSSGAFRNTRLHKRIDSLGNRGARPLFSSGKPSPSTAMVRTRRYRRSRGYGRSTRRGRTSYGVRGRRARTRKPGIAPRRTLGTTVRVANNARRRQPLTLGAFMQWQTDNYTGYSDHTLATPNPVFFNLNYPSRNQTTFKRQGTVSINSFASDSTRNYTNTVLTGINRAYLRFIYVKGWVTFNPEVQPEGAIRIRLMRVKKNISITDAHYEPDPWRQDVTYRDYNVLMNKVFKSGNRVLGVFGEGSNKIVPFAFKIPVNRWQYSLDAANAT